MASSHGCVVAGGGAAEDGNLVLREGKPGDPRPMEPVWQSGKPFGNKVRRRTPGYCGRSHGKVDGGRR